MPTGLAVRRRRKRENKELVIKEHPQGCFFNTNLRSPRGFEVGRKELNMGEFTPINTQEELDTIIKERLTRDRESQSKKYADYDDLKNKVTEYEDKIKEYDETIAKYDEKLKGIADKDKEIEALKGKVKAHETSSLKAKIAHEMGLPYGLSGRLSGEDEEAIKKDAESLKALIGDSEPKAPGVSTEPAGDNSKDASKAAMKNVLNGLKGES